ncbi:MAG: hypothetical protein LIP03_13450 [Bacteroidales bacterium]|nr:hypothetical protein [Bacteroidales bacterium]
MEKEFKKRAYVAPTTTWMRVEMEGGICTASMYGDTVTGNRHVAINQQENGGTIDFKNGDEKYVTNKWD